MSFILSLDNHIILFFKEFQPIMFVLNDNSLSSDQNNHIILSVTPINGFNNVPYMFLKKKKKNDIHMSCNPSSIILRMSFYTRCIGDQNRLVLFLCDARFDEDL